jgi:hypothetical protein
MLENWLKNNENLQHIDIWKCSYSQAIESIFMAQSEFQEKIETALNKLNEIIKF